MEKSENDSHSSAQRPQTDDSTVPALERGDEPVKAPVIHRRVVLMYLAAVVIMLLWPWVFFAVAKGKGGIEASAKLARQVQRYQQDVNYFTTVITAAFAWLVGHLFSKGVGFFTRTRISHSQLEIRGIKFLSVLVNHGFLYQKHYFGLVALFYMIVFLLVGPGLNALLIPTAILGHASLSGTELDFASTDPACVNWFINNQIAHTCDWTTYNNFSFSTCLGENQITDVLDSGRSQMLSTTSDKNESFTFTQLGGLHFSGPIQGVLPIGPNGLAAFNTINLPPHLEDKLGLAVTYDYTLDLQGVVSDISCGYDTESPIVVNITSNNYLYVNGSCSYPQTYAYGSNASSYYAPFSENLLAFWDCQTEASDTFVLYFQGNGAYGDNFGNVTCTASPTQIAVIPLIYNYTTDHFDTGSPSNNRFNTSTELLNRTIFSIEDVVAEGQGIETNLVGEAVITYGVKYFDIPVDSGQEYDQNDTYLRLLESMIQGMFEYEAAYIRMIYTSYNSAPTLAPESCIRDVVGSLNYKIIGWQVGAKSAAYLIPMTLINLTSLILLTLAAMHKELPDFDPTDLTSVIRAMGGGHVRLPAQNLDDPEDIALNTRLQYGPVPGVRPPIFALYSHDKETTPE